ncbi:uroporphyrinogen-III synthase [Agitococcus lubricus]|uniref:Uroporphyrinogen-III synthase n=1 Tax=Agitococcus lubricus TaxID=1077255 RepID=A0A2T5J3J5_9GAMM|nr:uroporphyrinogen-III synthase [Agitococcus lubricus]PTQ91073.1 uroporphyrinogen-III synthase [Agitococcus lubricus]
MADLAHWQIINTRPAARAASLTAALQAAGVTVFELPLLEIEPLVISDKQRQYLLNLSDYHTVFVVSPTAAQLGLAVLADYWPQWPVGMDWLAVGEATARVLREYQLDPIVPPQETSEGLLRLPALQQLSAGQRLLVLRGEGGRNLVREQLSARGVRVDYLDLYRRQLPALALQQWQSWQVQTTYQGVIITSGESWRYWLQITQGQATYIRPIIISERLGQLLQQEGCTDYLLARSTRPDDIILAIRQSEHDSPR